MSNRKGRVYDTSVSSNIYSKIHTHLALTVFRFYMVSFVFQVQYLTMPLTTAWRIEIVLMSRERSVRDIAADFDHRHLERALNTVVAVLAYFHTSTKYTSCVHGNWRYSYVRKNQTSDTSTSYNYGSISLKTTQTRRLKFPQWAHQHVQDTPDFAHRILS